MNSKNDVDKILEFYRDLDCTYFVLKIEDLLKSLDVKDWNDFQMMLDKYNEYRKNKVNKYFVVNRDDYPQFKSAQEFYDFLNQKIKDEQTQKEQTSN